MTDPNSGNGRSACRAAQKPEHKAIRLVCLDLDGTLLDPQHQLRPAVRDAIHRAHRSGIDIAIVTGRNMDSVLSVLAALDLDMELITSSGAHIRAFDGRSREIGLEPAQAAGIVDLALRAGSALFVDRPERSWALGDAQLFAQHAALTTDVLTTDVARALQFTPIKLSIINQKEVLAGLRETICRRYPELQLTTPIPTVLDLTHRDATKGLAVRTLGRMIGVSLDEVAAIGDSDNDMSMFQESALSIAMGNAPAEVKAVVDWVAPSNDNDGVAWAIDRILKPNGASYGIRTRTASAGR
jgi:Cof subfamily protein (haloacid dehalogenase superfamily)